MEMIIDGHAHSCGEFFEAKGIIAKLDELRVDKVVLFPGVKNGPNKYNFIPGFARVFSDADMLFNTNKLIKFLSKAQKPDDLMVRNEYVYSLYSIYPNRIIQFFWADPNSKQLEAHLHEKYNSWGFKGIKLHQCTHSFECDSREFDIVVKFARDKEIPIIIHLRSPGDVTKFINIAMKYREVNFIIAHLIGLELFIKHQAILDNLYFDISPAPLISSKRICLAIEKFGADKIVLGSDTPFGKDNLRKNLQKVKELKISDDERELIQGGNLQRLLRL